MMAKRGAVFSLLMALLPLIASAESSHGEGETNQTDGASMLESNMAAKEAGASRPYDTEQLARRHGLSLLPLLRPYVEHGTRAQKAEAAWTLWWIGGAVEEDNERRQVVTELANCMGPSASCDLTGVTSYLIRFRERHFSREAKHILFETFGSEVSAYREGGTLDEGLVLLMGVANVSDALPALKDLVPSEASGKDYTTLDAVEWAALRARARMGVAEDVKRCIGVVDACPNREKMVSLLFADLSFVRQPEVVDYMRPYLYSERMDDTGRSRDCLPMMYAQRVAAHLARMIEGFPAYAVYTPENVEECRDWLSAQETIEIRR